ncbi:type VI secretion system lipoprotein TssJ [Cupriavidus sp. 2TAF22]|uniref:type VI secretion system lipoprotein TssJ n=1 Tax=unclassified Cupriavidus TaxID=2640874 RepID=UPI003F906666
MKRALSTLLTVAFLSGCSTVGNVLKKTGQVLMDPSIQVGSAEDQPTRIALSLYAGSHVNPNPASLTATAADAADATSVSANLPEAASDGPYAIRLDSRSKAGLVEQLRSLLGMLEAEEQQQLTLSPQRPAAAKSSPRWGDSLRDMDVRNEDSAWPIPSLYGISPLPPIEAPKFAEALPTDTPRLLSIATIRPEAAADASPGDGQALGQYVRGTGLPATRPASLPQATASADASTPIAFKVLQLKDDSLLESADPEQLGKNLKKALGSTFISVDDYMLQPGQFKFIDFADIQADTRYLAIIAEFHDPNAERWKQVFRLESRGRKYALLVTLQNTRVTITDESYRMAPQAPSSKPRSRP